MINAETDPENSNKQTIELIDVAIQNLSKLDANLIQERIRIEWISPLLNQVINNRLEKLKQRIADHEKNDNLRKEEINQYQAEIAILNKKFKVKRKSTRVN